jgi:hypothetical protein
MAQRFLMIGEEVIQRGYTKWLCSISKVIPKKEASLSITFRSIFVA